MKSKLTAKEEYVLDAIIGNKMDEENVSKGRKGLHVVWSGFNAAFADKFGTESKATTDGMVKKGLIESKPWTGGVLLFLSGDAPKYTDKTAERIASLNEKAAKAKATREKYLKSL